MRIETSLLHVSSDDIRYEGVVKHTDVRFELESISIKEIEDNIRVSKLPLEELPLLINKAKYESSKKIAHKRLKGE